MKIRNLFIIVLIIIAIILVTNFVFYDKYKMPKDVEIIMSDKKIEVYTLPRTARTNLICGYFFWKCKPRSTPLVELDWLS